MKDRATLQMIQGAIEIGKLKKHMTIAEGTASNIGIGLTVVGRSLGYKVLVVMPSEQAIEKENTSSAR